MSQAQSVPPLVVTLVAGGFTTVGILKMSYDALAARRVAKKEGLERFAVERREAYNSSNGTCTATSLAVLPSTIY